MSTFKTTWGKGIALAMAATLIVSSVPGTEAQAAKKAKLSTKKLTVEVGKKKTIKIKNQAKKAKYTFKSKKASIAKVSKKGVVTGKKAGSTKITVTEKNGKKKRKLGTVKVTVKKSTPTVTTAPVQTATPVASAAASATPGASTNPGTNATNAPDVSSANPTVAPTNAPTVAPSKGPGKTKPPTVPPTQKPTPTQDPWEPAQDASWTKIDLSSWSGDEGNFLETGNQFILQDTELVTLPLPTSLENLGDKVEVLIRGSVSKDSDGFRFWLANEANATRSGQYYYMAEVGEKYVFGPDKDHSQEKQIGEFKPGESFHIQTVLENVNWDNDADIACTRLLLKATQPGGSLDGVTITGIWVRYGDKIGTTTEDPTKIPEIDTSSVETYAIDFEADYKEEGGNNLEPTVKDGVLTAEFINPYEGFNYILPDTPLMNALEFKYVTITYTNTDNDVAIYFFDGGTDLGDPDLSQNSSNKHELIVQGKARVGLPKAEQERTITFSVTDTFEKNYDFSKSSFRGFQIFNWENLTTLTIKSVVFSKTAP